MANNMEDKKHEILSNVKAIKVTSVCFFIFFSISFFVHLLAGYPIVDGVVTAVGIFTAIALYLMADFTNRAVK